MPRPRAVEPSPRNTYRGGVFCLMKRQAHHLVAGLGSQWWELIEWGHCPARNSCSVPDSLMPSLSDFSVLLLGLFPTEAWVQPHSCHEGPCFTSPEGIILLCVSVWGAVVGVPPERTGLTRDVTCPCRGDEEHVLLWGKLGTILQTLGELGLWPPKESWAFSAKNPPMNHSE